MTTQSHALVAGGGVAGLTAAIALARAGLRVTVVERAPSFEEVGAGLQLSPNAGGALRDLGLLPAVSRYASTPDQVRIRRARDGRDIARVPLGPIAELRWGAPYLTLQRADLQRALVEACEADPAIEITMGATIVGFATLNDGVEVAARQGEETLRLEANSLIVADGLRSTLRARIGLGLADRPVWSGRSAWRGLAPAREAPAFARALETTLWLGAHAHLVHYPVRQGDFVNIVAIAEDSWRGEDAADLWSIAGKRAELAPRFVHWCLEARTLIGAAPEWRKWPLFDRAPSRRWTYGRAALIGDAAHPMLPFLAQGASQAIEDAAELGSAFAKADGDVERAFRIYETARLARAAAVVLASRRQGAIYHMGGPLALARDATMRALGPHRMLSRLDWLYDSKARG